jgi:flagellar M-ring protein FliF
MAKIELLDQAKNFSSKLSKTQKIGIIATVGAVVLGIVIIMLMTGESKEMSILYSNLNEAEAAKIVELLKTKTIKYELKDNGTTILVDKAKLYETRLEVASEGLPESGTVGYELFDKTNLGMSEFVQKLNYRRAIEGELTRTISSLDEVKKVRVHIVIPEKALFEKDQNKPSASVTLHLKTGKNLSNAAVRGIQNLVASSVEGLQTDDVTIIDQRGKVMSESQPDAKTSAGLTASQHAQQVSVESYVAGKVQSLLDGVLGSGNSEVRVNADLNFTQIEKTITDFDPERQVTRSEQLINEKSQSTDSLNYPAVNLAKDQSNQISNYEISKSVQRIIEEVGNIKRLSVAVMVNHTSKVVDNNGVKSLQYVPRTEEEMQKLTETVKNSVGYDPTRNDQVTVLNVPFDSSILEDQDKVLQEVPWWKDPQNIKLLGLVAAILLTVFLMWRLLHAKQIKDKVREAFSLPEKVEIDETEEAVTHEEDELEEIELDEDQIMLLPTELPDQLLLEGISMTSEGGAEEEHIDLLDKDALAERAKARLEGGEGMETTEETLMKLELKGKVQDYAEYQPQEAARLVRLFLAQDLDERGLKF